MIDAITAGRTSSLRNTARMPIRRSFVVCHMLADIESESAMSGPAGGSTVLIRPSMNADHT